jgi:hypothetical protein
MPQQGRKEQEHGKVDGIPMTPRVVHMAFYGGDVDFHDSKK